MGSWACAVYIMHTYTVTWARAQSRCG